MRFFSQTEEEEEDSTPDIEECEFRVVDEEIVLEATRVRQKFTFIRGGKKTLEWHEWESFGHESGGVMETKRADAAVERFLKLEEDGKVVWPSGGPELIIKPSTREVGEVTVANVAFRGEREEEPIELVAHCEFTEYIHEGEVVKRKTFPDVKDYELREVNDD